MRTLLKKLALWNSASRRQLHAIYANQAVVEFDARGHVLGANKRFLALMG